MEVSLTFTIKAEVATEEEKNYFLDSATNNPSIPVLADILDCTDGIVFEKVTSINDKTPEQLKAALQAELPL